MSRERREETKEHFFTRKPIKRSMQPTRGSLFKFAEELSGIGRRYNGVKKDTNGNKITVEHDKVRSWKEHVQSMLSREEPLTLNEWYDYTRNECTVDTAKKDSFCPVLT